jgi:prepilin-type N-terminal cleavage/methylation domain-containing protein
MKKYKGFSLIELSIVLIIIGLLVAGIVGGAALVKSAQLRGVVSEAQSHRSGVNTYYGLYGRMPGAPEDNKYKIVTSASAWTALKKEGIIERSLETDGSIGSKYRNAYWYLENAGPNFFISDFKDMNILIICGRSNASNVTTKTGTFPQKDAQHILEKLDDGDPSTSLVRAIYFAAVDSAAGEETAAECREAYSECATGLDPVKDEDALEECASTQTECLEAVAAIAASTTTTGDCDTTYNTCMSASTTVDSALTDMTKCVKDRGECYTSVCDNTKDICDAGCETVVNTASCGTSGKPACQKDLCETSCEDTYTTCKASVPNSTLGSFFVSNATTGDAQAIRKTVFQGRKDKTTNDFGLVMQLDF